MKKAILTVVALSSIVFVLPYCNSTKKATATKHKVNYVNDIEPLMIANCSPCHFPPKGRKLPLDSFMSVKANIDDILVRIQKEPTEKGFMPFKHEKLSDSTIMVFKQWVADGLLEK